MICFVCSQSPALTFATMVTTITSAIIPLTTTSSCTVVMDAVAHFTLDGAAQGNVNTIQCYTR